MSSGDARYLAASVLRSLKGLHAKGIVHGDIKCGNTLVTMDQRYVLSDLGRARVAERRGGCLVAPADVYGTPVYTAPEAKGTELEPLKPYTSKADVYSAGIMLLAACTHSTDKEAMWDAVEARAAGEHVWTPAYMPPSLRRLVRWLTAWDPAKRPTASQALRCGQLRAAAARLRAERR